MNSNKQTVVKRTNTHLLDAIVPDINVPIMKTSERKRSKKIDLILKNGSKML